MNSPSERSDTNRTGGTVAATEQVEVVDYRGTAERMVPVSEASVVQLQPGPAPTNLEIFSSNKVSVLGLQHHVASVGIAVMKPEYFGFMWWDGSEDCRINGELAQRTMIYTQGEQDGFYAAGGARRTTGIAVHRNDLIETLAALRGVGPEDVLLKRAGLELSPEAATCFRTDVDALVRTAIESGTADPSEAIFGLLVDAYLRGQPEQLRDGRARRPEQIVRKAEERYLASQGASLSLADLCAATRVSQTTLYRAFHAVCGESPLAYFHKRGLTDARRALIKSPEYRGAVKHTALSVGLTEFGRFSVEYRRLFGESPSATLRRNIHL